MSEAEFQRALVTVLVVGTLVMGIGAGALFLIFRRFDSAKGGSGSQVALLVGLVVFILTCCALILRFF